MCVPSLAYSSDLQGEDAAGLHSTSRERLQGRRLMLRGGAHGQPAVKANGSGLHHYLGGHRRRLQ